MSDYMIPSDDEYVEAVAKAIARNRLFEEAAAQLGGITGIDQFDSLVQETMRQSFDIVFQRLWDGTSEIDMQQKAAYRADARAAIAALNLKLLTKV